MGVQVTDRITTVGQSDVFATHDSNRGALGFHAVNSILERNQITYDRRRGTYQVEADSPYPFFVSVRDGNTVKLYWLKNEPGTDLTTDSDWEEYVATVEEPFQGFFDPATTDLVDGVGTKGHYWIAEVAGTFNGEAYLQYDKSIYDGVAWRRVGAGSVVADWNTMVNKPNGFTPTAHTHETSDINGLDAILDNKVDWASVEDEITGDANKVPNSKAVKEYTYSQETIDYKISNLLTYGLKYSWPNSSSQLAQTGMKVSENGIREDEQKVYQWDGTSWKYFTTINTSGAALTQSITSKVDVGNIKNGQTLNIGTLFTEFVKKLLLKVTNPTYTQPSVSLTNTQGYKEVEIGSILNITVNPSINVGDSGGVYSYVLNRDSTIVLNSSSASAYTDSNVSILFATGYSATTKFSQGAIKYDDDTPPQPYPTGRINDTTLTSATMWITPYRNLFYGTSKDSGTSANIRAFGNTYLNPYENYSFEITILAGATNVVFAYPDILRAVSKVVDTGTNLDIKSSFVQTSVNVEGANGATAIPYRVYKFVPVASYSQDVKYIITI
jgi:hypothetical protein